MSESAARRKESAALAAIRSLDVGKCSVDDCLSAVLEYEATFGREDSKHVETYRETLEAMPWKSCECDICKKDGVEVILFRGNNRNRRRGFHNTFVFYRMLQGILNGTMMPPGANSANAIQPELEF